MRKEIRLSGSGGQGLILAGVILAEGAILSNLNSVQSQSYGPEARGGASKAEVIISDDEINFPKVSKSDILVSLTQKSFNEYATNVKEDGIIIIDDSIDTGSCNIERIYKLPILTSASDVMKKPMTANIITLGVLVSFIDDVNKEETKKAIKNRVPFGSEAINLEAFELGLSMVKK